MRLIEFTSKFPDEASCKAHFKSHREEEGIKCSKCGNTTHYWKAYREQWECKKCRHRTTLKSGTVMHHSKLPFQTWYIAMHLLTSTKKTFSAKEIQRQLGHSRYESIWSMCHKIRAVMGLRDDKYKLSEEIELDEGFFESVSAASKEAKNKKRGKGSEKQTKVLVTAMSKKADEPTKGKAKTVKFIKMKVLETLTKEEIKQKTEQGTEKGAKIVADGYPAYSGLKENFNLDSAVRDKEEVNKILPWVHTAISNAKRLLLDAHHRIDKDFMQNYLNEFCYKFNRRYFDCKFDRLVVASVNYRWD